MMNDPLFLLAAVACLAVLAILVMGVSTFGKGGEEAGNRANKFMRWRIYAQFVAVALILLFVFIRRGA